MSLRRVLAAGFKHHGREPLSETELVAALALDRGWFAPDEARELLRHAIEVGELTGDANALEPAFEVGSITVPSDFEPPADLTETPAPFERILGRLEAAGCDKREAVAGINRLQSAACITNDAAAVLYARQAGIEVSTEADQVRQSVESGRP